ncbi:TonB-dependent receptor [uncultured Erythrobacter sp.]|uniref:TonB-dependent receptor n=1 Tax=uncultured Erythrobacter sp. TaxID=263913 RepID=UPI002634FBF9|nr:TonB-dependent receptor [uncultured Erythrobacter sp.]
MKKVIRGALLAATVMTPGALLAQDTGATADEANAEERNDNVIIVTARKTEESIQDVPIAVSAFTSEDLFEQGIRDIEDLSRRTPGFVFDTPFGRQFDRPIIRGQANILGDSGVSVFIDNVNVTQSIRSLNFGDIDTIEIIKGPQSALFGRNTYSGAINITTRQPTNDFGGELSVEVGEDNLYEVLGNIRGPIIEDKLFFSLSARYYDFQSEFDRPGNLNPSVGNESSFSIGGTLEFRPTPGWTSKLRIAYNEDDDGHFPIGLFGFPNLNVNVPGGIDLGGNQPFFQGVVPTSAPNPSGSPQISNTLGEGGGLEREEFFLSLNNEFELGEYTLVTTLGYTREEFRDELDSDGQPTSFGTASVANPFPAPFIFPGATGVVLLPFDFTTTDDDLQTTYVAEVRLDSPQDRPFRWRVGGYYFRNNERDESLLGAFTPERQAAIDASGQATIQQIAAALGVPSFTIINLGGGFANGPADPEELTVENFSVFGSVAYDLSDRLTATAELRWADETQRLRVFDFNTGALTTLADGSAFDVEASFDAITPRFIIDYEATPDNLIYASAARGTKPGGFNGAQGFEFGFGTFEEESVWQFELGSKNAFANGDLIFNVAAFYSALQDYQLTENLAALGATSTTGSVTANLGDVDVYGVEIDAIWTPAALPGVTLGGNYAWTDTEFTSGTEATQGAVFGDPDLTGQSLPRQARHQASFYADYEAELSDDFAAVFSVNGNYLSSRFAQVQNLAETGEAFELDARVTFKYGDNLSLTVYGRNLTNEDAPLGVLRFIDPTGGNGSFVVNGTNIANGFTLSSAGQSRGFQFNNRLSRRFGAIVRLQF